MKENKMRIDSIERARQRQNEIYSALYSTVQSSQDKKRKELDKIAEYKAEAIAHKEYLRIRKELYKEANLDAPTYDDEGYSELSKRIEESLNLNDKDKFNLNV